MPLRQVIKLLFKLMLNENSTDKLRLFVAIPVPDAVREGMLRVQRELQPLAPPRAVRWTKPDQFHLTLKFLGNVSADRAADLREAIRKACVGAAALLLRAQGIGFFPKARSPRIIWIGITDSENRLVDLQRKIEAAVQPFTAEPGGERFAGHVTLGRFKAFKQHETGELTARVETMKERVFGEWTAGEIQIIRSKLLLKGPLYTPLAAIRLGTEIAPQ